MPKQTTPSNADISKAIKFLSDFDTTTKGVAILEKILNIEYKKEDDLFTQGERFLINFFSTECPHLGKMKFLSRSCDYCARANILLSICYTFGLGSPRYLLAADFHFNWATRFKTSNPFKTEFSEIKQLDAFKEKFPELTSESEATTAQLKQISTFTKKLNTQQKLEIILNRLDCNIENIAPLLSIQEHTELLRIYGYYQKYYHPSDKTFSEEVTSVFVIYQLGAVQRFKTLITHHIHAEKIRTISAKQKERQHAKEAKKLLSEHKPVKKQPAKPDPIKDKIMAHQVAQKIKTRSNYCLEITKGIVGLAVAAPLFVVNCIKYPFTKKSQPIILDDTLFEEKVDTKPKAEQSISKSRARLIKKKNSSKNKSTAQVLTKLETIPVKSESHEDKQETKHDNETEQFCTLEATQEKAQPQLLAHETKDPAVESKRTFFAPQQSIQNPEVVIPKHNKELNAKYSSQSLIATLHTINKDALTILQILENNQNSPVIYGGIVRSILLSEEIKDIDICIKGNLYELESLFSGKIKGEIIRSTIPIFKIPNQCPIEINMHEGEKDFTINCGEIRIAPCTAPSKLELKIDISPQGYKDIKDKIIRTVIPAQESFTKDPLRILRAIYFASRLNEFKFETELEKQIVQAGEKFLKSAPQKRILHDLTKMLNLTDINRKKYLWLLKKYKLNDVVIPVLEQLSKETSNDIVRQKCQDCLTTLKEPLEVSYAEIIKMNTQQTAHLATYRNRS